MGGGRGVRGRGTVTVSLSSLVENKTAARRMRLLKLLEVLQRHPKEEVQKSEKSCLS
jgi:hypothetical protein